METGAPASAIAATNALGGSPAPGATYRSPTGRVVSITPLLLLLLLRRRAVAIRSISFLRFVQTQLVATVLAINLATGRSSLIGLFEVMQVRYPFGTALKRWGVGPASPSRSLSRSQSEPSNDLQRVDGLK